MACIDWCECCVAVTGSMSLRRPLRVAFEGARPTWRCELRRAPKGPARASGEWRRPLSRKRPAGLGPRSKGWLPANDPPIWLHLFPITPTTRLSTQLTTSTSLRTPLNLRFHLHHSLSLTVAFKMSVSVVVVVADRRRWAGSRTGGNWGGTDQPRAGKAHWNAGQRSPPARQPTS